MKGAGLRYAHPDQHEYGAALAEFSGSGRNDADKFTAFVALDLKDDFAVCCCEQGMILAATDVVTGMKMRAALTNDDVACLDGFAAEAFDA